MGRAIEILMEDGISLALAAVFLAIPYVFIGMLIIVGVSRKGWHKNNIVNFMLTLLFPYMSYSLFLNNESETRIEGQIKRNLILHIIIFMPLLFTRDLEGYSFLKLSISSVLLTSILLIHFRNQAMITLALQYDRMVDETEKLIRSKENLQHLIKTKKKALAAESKDFRWKSQALKTDLYILDKELHRLNRFLRPQQQLAEDLQRNIQIISELDRCRKQGLEIAIDTNVLMKLNNDLLELIKRNKIVISRMVRREWDFLKKNEHRETRGAAARASDVFDAMVLNEAGREIEDGWTEPFVIEHKLRMENNDDHIVADFLYEKIKGGANLIAASDDTDFVTSARLAGLPVLEIKIPNYKENWSELIV